MPFYFWAFVRVAMSWLDVATLVSGAVGGGYLIWYTLHEIERRSRVVRQRTAAQNARMHNNFAVLHSSINRELTMARHLVTP